MRWLVLMGLLTVSCLPPHAEPLDPTPEIFLDFPELSQWGHVVLIGGREYWRPDPAFYVFVPSLRRTAPPHDAWMPYGNGYFYEDTLDGLVWVSHDPWGFITSHYGYWRHHEQLGYVWRPLEPLAWRPFVATILYDDRGLIFGICPFSMLVWETGLYDLGFGFDDAYWAPAWSRVGAPGFYTSHWQRFDGYWISVTLYEEEMHWRDVPENRHRDDPERRRRPHSGRDRGGESREPEGRQRDVEPIVVGEGLPARPVTTPPSPERRGEDGSPPAPAGLPSIPARDLNPRRAGAAREEPPPVRLDAGELHPATPQRPSSSEAAPAPPRRADPQPEPAPPARPGPTAEEERSSVRSVATKRAALPVIEPSPAPKPAKAPEASQSPKEAVEPSKKKAEAQGAKAKERVKESIGSRKKGESKER
jgi:hypothetical protein